MKKAKARAKHALIVAVLHGGSGGCILYPVVVIGHVLCDILLPMALSLLLLPGFPASVVVGARSLIPCAIVSAEARPTVLVN